MKYKLLIITCVSILFPLIYGCIPSKPTESIEILPSERLVKKLEANRRKIKNFEGNGTVGVSTPELNTSISFNVKLIRPDSVFVDFYGPFGIDLAQAVISSNYFTFYDMMNNVVYKGRSDNDVLKRIFKVDLTFNELMDILVGSVNLTVKLTREPDNYEVVYDRYILSYNENNSGRKSKYFVDVRELAITKYQILNSSDNILAEGTYSKFRVIENISIPYSIKVERKAAKQELNIEYKNIVVNKDNVQIKLEIPDDAEIINM